MPYSCHKCGSSLEEGTPFCPHCGAPQIRVAMPENDSPGFIPGTPAEMQPPAEPVPIHSLPLPRAQGSIDWRAAFPTIGIAGFFTGLASLLPLGIVWVIAGGILTVVLYRKRHPEASPLTSGSGARMGAATGQFPVADESGVDGVKRASIGTRTSMQIDMTEERGVLRTGTVPQGLP